jgi:hypothetical protein
LRRCQSPHLFDLLIHGNLRLEALDFAGKPSDQFFPVGGGRLRLVFGRHFTGLNEAKYIFPGGQRYLIWFG